MARSDRLFEIMQMLRGGALHRAQDIAATVDVSVRTIYRDIDTLIASGVPIEGARGVGYRTLDVTTLPPMTLTHAELEALNLGLAIVVEAADPTLKAVAESLTAKLDAALTENSVEAREAWKFDQSPFADAARGFSYMPLIRAAIKAKQKLQITYNSVDNRVTSHSLLPLKMENWGRVWTLTAWCEDHAQFSTFRLDLLQSADAKPEMFVDEPGKRLRDYNA